MAKDVCECLDIGNSRDAVAALDEDEKGVDSIDTPGGAQALGYERPNDAVNTHCKKVNKFSYGDMPQ